MDLLALSTLGFLVCLAPGPAAGVLVVDAAGGPGADFADIQPAVDAALDEDVILVRTGSYGPVTIDGRSLSVVADEGAVVTLSGAFRIVNVEADQRVVVAGLERVVTSDNHFVADEWAITDCAGPVLLQDCGLRLTVDPSVLFGPVARIEDAASVVLTRFAFRDGGFYASAVFATDMMLFVAESNVSLFDSEIIGFDGNQEVDGFAAVVLSASSLFASGSTLRGGTGADQVLNPVFGTCIPPGDGGNALVFASPSGVALLDSPLIAGVGGEFFPGSRCKEPPVDGVAVSGTGSVTELAPSARSFHATTPVRHGETLVATHSGEEGDFAFTAYSARLAPTPFFDAIHGPLVPDPLRLSLDAMGVVPAGGSITTNFPVSFPHPGVAGELFAQGLFLTPAAEAVVAGGQGLVYLGPGLSSE